MYLTYDDYEEYGGTLDETTFNDYEWEAETLVNWYTFNRLKKETTYPEEVKRCMYHLIRLAKLKADALDLGSSGGGVSGKSTEGGSGAIASQSNDGVSISYNVMNASEAFQLLTSRSAGNIVEDTVKRYLNGVVNSLGQKLLYRGFYENE